MAISNASLLGQLVFFILFFFCIIIIILIIIIKIIVILNWSNGLAYDRNEKRV